MFKIKKSLILLVILAFSSLFLLSGCGKKECKVNSDCASLACSTAKCADNKCEYAPVPNCCGNGIKDATENGKPGDKCTCPEDYGKCEGKGKIMVANREFDAQYLKYLCNAENKCVFGVDEKSIQVQRLIDDKVFSFFELETIVEFNKPFDIKNDNFKFEFNLKDDNEDLVYPIKFTEIQLLDREVFFGSTAIDKELSKVGDKISINVPVDYQLADIEEERQLSYKLRFEYTKRLRTGTNPDGTYSYKNEPEREEYQKFFGSKIFFVKTGEE